MRFRLRKESRTRAAFCVVADWLRNSKLGWNWLLVVLCFQVVSAWTNTLGLALALPWTGSVIMGIGIQLMLLYAGVRLMHTHEEDRDRWKKPVYTLICLSAFFSFVGFTRFYAEYREASDRPIRLREDLKIEGQMLAAKADEARMIAMQALTNRIDYAQGQIAVINRKQQDGLYGSDVYPAAEIARHERSIQEAEAARQKWSGLKIDVTGALQQQDPMQGFAVLKQGHDQLGLLIGSIRPQEKGDFQMPSPPMPSKLNGDEVNTDPIRATMSTAFSMAGLFWLVLAFLIEAAPFMLAHANSSRPLAAEADSESTPELAPAHYWSVQPRGAHDERLASEITKLHELIACGAQAGAFDLTQQLDQEERLEPIRKYVQVVGSKFVENAQLESSARAEIERARKFFDQMAEISPDVRLFEDQVIRQIIQKHAMACGYFIEMPAEAKAAQRVAEWSEAAT